MDDALDLKEKETTYFLVEKAIGACPGHTCGLSRIRKCLKCGAHSCVHFGRYIKLYYNFNDPFVYFCKTCSKKYDEDIILNYS